MKKQILSILLVLALCLGLSAAAFASGEAEGTESGKGAENETASGEAAEATPEPTPGSSADPSSEWSWGTTTGQCGENVTWTLTDGLLTISGTGPMTDYDYPEGGPWGNKVGMSVTTAVIEPGVTTIGEYVFLDCGALTSVTIPDTVTRIGDGAFRDCIGLKDVYYTGTAAEWQAITIAPGNYMTSYGARDTLYRAVIHCSDDDLASDEPSAEQPEEYVQSGKIEVDLRWTYDMKTGELTISGMGQMQDMIYWVDWGNFLLDRPWPNPKNVVIMPGIANIGGYAFKGCTSLQSVTIPLSVTEIGDHVFEVCTSLTDVYYAGTESDWANITIGDSNEPLTEAQIHYNWTPPEPFDADGSGVIDAADAAFLLRSGSAQIAAALIIAALTLQKAVGIRG